MDRFYKTVATGPAMSGGGYVVLLDTRPVRTPEKELMAAPNEKLAQAIATEWNAQEKRIIPETMPLTQILTTAIDRIGNQRAAITEMLLPYLNSDLLCYRADEPLELKAEQSRLWSPWLQWFETRFGIALETTFALIRLDQPKAAHDAVKAHVNAMDTAHFTVFQLATGATGSIVLGLALTEGALTAQDALRAALCEELFYEHSHDLERHGLDPIEQRRRDSLQRDLDACVRYLELSE